MSASISIADSAALIAAQAAADAAILEAMQPGVTLADITTVFQGLSGAAVMQDAQGAVLYSGNLNNGLSTSKSVGNAPRGFGTTA